MNGPRDSHSSIHRAQARNIALRIRNKPKLRNGHRLLWQCDRIVFPYFQIRIRLCRKNSSPHSIPDLETQFAVIYSSRKMQPGVQRS